MTSMVWSSSIIAQTATAIGMHGDHLDLRAALAAFQESQTLDDFERKLNDPYEKIHDLDLNGDNYIDYLAVIDQTDGYTHAITIRALLGDGESQDVAVIAVEKNGNNSADLQIIGDVNLYGHNYIIDPYGYDSGFATVSTFNVWMWPVVQLMFSPHYYCYVSPYRWQYYPVWWTTWHPVGYTVYYNHCHRWRTRYYYTNNCRVSRAHTVYVSNRCVSPRSLSYDREPRPSISTNNNYGNNGGYGSNSGNGGNGQVTPSVIGSPSNTRQGNLPPQTVPSNQPNPSSRPSKFEAPENPGYKPNRTTIGNEKPMTEKPRAQDPRTQKPMSQSSTYEAPRAEDPRTQKPSYEAPRGEDPRPQKPSSETQRPANPTPLKPSFEAPRAEDPRPQKPSYEAPRAEDPRPQKPSYEQSRPQAEAKPQSRPSYEAERPANNKPREEKPSVVRESNDRPAPSRPSQSSGGSTDRSRSGGGSKPSNSGSGSSGGGSKSSPSKRK